MYLFMRKKAVYFTRKTALSVVEPTKPVGPVYEEVLPKKDIELNTNQAYGPVGPPKEDIELHTNQAYGPLGR